MEDQLLWWLQQQQQNGTQTVSPQPGPQPIAPIPVPKISPVKVPPAKQQASPMGQQQAYPAGPTMATLPQGAVPQDMGPVTSTAPVSPQIAPVQVPKVTVQGGAPIRDKYDQMTADWEREVAAQRAAPGLVLNGTQMTTRTFLPDGGFSVQQRDLDPIAIARQMAMANGGYGDWRDYVGTSKGVSEVLMQQAVNQLISQRDYQAKMRQTDVDERARLGEVGVKERNQAMLEKELAFKQGPEGLVHAAIAAKAASGGTAADMAAVRTALQQTLGGGAAPPGAVAGGAAPTPAPTMPTVPGPMAPSGAVPQQDATLGLTALDPHLVQELTTGGEGGKGMDVQRAWQHIFDKKGQEWIEANKDVVLAYLSKVYGADAVRNMPRAGFDRVLTGLPDLLIGGLSFLPGGENRKFGPTPQGRANYQDLVNTPLNERWDRFVGTNVQQSNANAFLRALTR